MWRSVFVHSLVVQFLRWDDRPGWFVALYNGGEVICNTDYWEEIVEEEDECDAGKA